MSNSRFLPSEAPGASRGCFRPRHFFLLILLMMGATFPAILIGKQTFVFRDFGLFSYPAAFFQRECFWHGELPLWNPFSNCGIPFLAQWNTMALYPPSLIYLLLPLEWSLPFFCLVHLIWGGLGMYLLARQWTKHDLAAALAGIGFSFNGLTLNFLMWPSHLATFSWVPWVLWLVPQACRNGGRALAYAALVASLQVLAGGPETVLFTWLLLLLLAVGQRVTTTRQPADKTHSWVQQHFVWNRADTRFALRFLGTAVLVFAVCAAQLLPFLALLSNSQRDTAYSSNSHNWGMPFWGWANFLVPLFRSSPNSQGVFFQNGQYWTSSYYAGIATVFLCLVAVWRVRDWRVRLLAGAGFLALLLAWGDTSVLFCVLRSVFPGLGFVRYPVKFVIIVLAVAPLLAAFGAKALSERRLGPFEWACVIGILALIGAIIAVEDRFPQAGWTATCQNGIARAAFLLMTVGLIPLALSKASRYQPLFAWLLLGVIWLDLRTHVPNQNPTADPSIYTSNCLNNEFVAGHERVFMSPNTRDFLAYNSLANSTENFRRNRSLARPNANILDGIAQVDGFFSLVPRESFVVNKLLYSPRDTEPVGLLDFLSVSRTTGPEAECQWMPRPHPLPPVTAGQQPVFADAASILRALTNAATDLSSIIYLPPEARRTITAGPQATARVLNPRFEHQEISMQTEAPGPSLVVISQTYDRNWNAYVDGRRSKLWRANYAFQAVEVPKGTHRLRLVYQDIWFRAGLVLSSAGLLIVLYLARRKAPALCLDL